MNPISFLIHFIKWGIFKLPGLRSILLFLELPIISCYYSYGHSSHFFETMFRMKTDQNIDLFLKPTCWHELYRFNFMLSMGFSKMSVCVNCAVSIKPLQQVNACYCHQPPFNMFCLVWLGKYSLT